MSFQENSPQKPAQPKGIKPKFIIAGVLFIAAVVYLVYSATSTNAQYFLTVEELLGRKSEMTGKSVRVSGVVLGQTIQVDSQALNVRFTVAHIPGDQKTIDQMGGMAKVLEKASQDGSLARLAVLYKGVKPDLLKDKSQAIMTGRLQPDGTFLAEELLLKCPTRYEEVVPNQTNP